MQMMLVDHVYVLSFLPSPHPPMLACLLVQQKVLQAEKEVNLTFHPVICKKSLATVRKLRAEEGAADEPFYERLATGTSKQYMQDVLLKVQAELELRECTFQPKLFTDNSRFRLKSTM